MWVVTLFDLPTETRKQRTNYRRFREFLLSEGYFMLQYSVYSRPCATMEIADRHALKIEEKMPPEGQVRVMTLTAIQYARMKCFYGETRSDPEKPPEQLSFF
jgi:CRISPR-associated protein Cas2